MDILVASMVIMAGVCLYLLPSIVASSRKHKNANSICVLNIFFGWTLVGWVVSLAMAVSGNVETKSEALA